MRRLGADSPTGRESAPRCVGALLLVTQQRAASHRLGKHDPQTGQPFGVELASRDKCVRMVGPTDPSARRCQGWDLASPCGCKSTANGDSRGRWEGDTLVVETTNFNDKGSIATSAATGRMRSVPQTSAMKVVERFTPVDRSTIAYQVTIDDPKVYT